MKTLSFISAAMTLAAAAQAQDVRLSSAASAYAHLSAQSLRDSSRGRLATVEGRVRLTGLDSAVEVRRDQWGVPHIYARTAHDVFFAQGYVAAQDRLFQMEIWRRAGEGRLAEVLGPAYVSRDRLSRLFKYRGDMRAEWASYAPDARQLVTAFVSGVNAYIDEVRANPRKLPIEFSILGFLPERWTPEVPLTRVTPLSGVGNGTSELLRARLVSLVGIKRTEELLPTYPSRALDPVPGVDYGGLSATSLGGIGQVYTDVTFSRIEGSNNWVVSGKKTASGKPILANDPHRAITNPGVRYITHLVAPGWNVIGAGEPASPGVAIGHNERIAFGLTIVGMDQQDIYLEQLAPCANEARQLCVNTGSMAQAIRSIPDTIRVRGEAPRVVALQFTGHGPILTIDSARHRAIVVRMVGQEPGTAAYLASLSLDRASNWSSFQRALARWKLPDENMIYADVDGNIGWIASGLMPRRGWSGLLPVPGDGRHEWQGFVPVEQLPQRYNPSTGYIATANDDILRYMPPSYLTPISYEFPHPSFRAERLHEVLRDSSGFTVRDFERLQHDDLSLLARGLAPLMVQAATRAGAGNRPEVQALASWDYHMSKDATAPLIFESWSTALTRLADNAAYPREIASLLRGETERTTVDSVLRAGGRGDTLAVAALDSAVATITRRLGPNGTSKTWGDLHVVELKHPVSPAFDLPPLARGGDANTVMATGGANFRQTAGASYREIIDLGDFDNSVAINVPGQSAQPESEHYADLLPLWGQGKYFPLAYSRKKVEEVTAHVLVLEPAR
ncbi:MAG TPA: penicillin acylase family protein [Gemmatimonadaceae bacterium]